MGLLAKKANGVISEVQRYARAALCELMSEGFLLKSAKQDRQLQLQIAAHQALHALANNGDLRARAGHECENEAFRVLEFLVERGKTERALTELHRLAKRRSQGAQC